MAMAKFKTFLLLGSALIVSACSQGNAAEDTAANKTKETAAKAVKTMKDTPRKMIDYTTAGQTDEDHLYLEEVLGDKALGEVKGWNKRTLDRLTADPRFKTMEAEALEILQSKDKIPYVSYRGGEVHNFWQDETHVRGIWRKSTLESYLTDSPAWETVLDYDKLSADEGKNWVYKGNDCLAPDYNKCLIRLSDGGKDAVVVREFDAKTKSFVKGGFETPESKGGMSWLDEDMAVVGIDFGDGTVTDSGYPFVSKLWKRGTPLSDATEIYRGTKDDVSAGAYVWELDDDRKELFAYKSSSFYDREYFWLPQKDGKLLDPVKVPVSQQTRLSAQFKGQFIAQLNDDWGGYKTGDLVSFGADDFFEDGAIDKVHLVYSPDAKSSIGSFGTTKSKLLAAITSDVVGSAYSFDWQDGKWTSEKLDFPSGGSISIGNTNDKEDIAFISSESFLTPDTLWTYNTATGVKAKAKSLPDWFDASSMVSEQFFATSTDGTKVPLFCGSPKRHKDGRDKSNAALWLWRFPYFAKPEL